MCVLLILGGLFSTTDICKPLEMPNFALPQMTAALISCKEFKQAGAFIEQGGSF